jgi:DNA-binding NtrC family response regulator
VTFTVVPAPLAGLRLLLVEDDPEVREATAALLEEEGARIALAGSAEQALALLKSPGPSSFDLVLTDVVLGGDRNGFDVAAAALEARPALPVVLVTGYVGPASSVPAHLPRSVPLLFKPFRRADLLAAIVGALARPLSRAEPAAA